MADTPEGALRDHMKVISDRQELKMADAMHLPFQHCGHGWARQWDSVDEVPEYPELPAAWQGSYCELISLELVLGTDVKQAYKIAAMRYDAEGREMWPFEAIYTVRKVDGDWQVILRNPIVVPEQIEVGGSDPRDR